eukprot:3718420-Heterocapsa_arctica.AAC.1
MTPPAMVPPPGPPPTARPTPVPMAPLQLLTPSSKAPALPRALPPAPTEEVTATPVEIDDQDQADSW